MNRFEAVLSISACAATRRKPFLEETDHDGFRVHEVVELFVMSQMEGTGEGMVQMDYEEFEEVLLRMVG
jgi:hypothetical protein